MRIDILAGEAPETYALLAPFAMSRAVVRELGGPVYTGPGYRWVVAHADDGDLLGWAGVDLSKDGKATLDWSYVLLAHRRRGVFEALTARRFDLGAGRVLMASTRHAHLQSWYLRQGFTETRRNGCWTSYRRAP